MLDAHMDTALWGLRHPGIWPSTASSERQGSSEGQMSGPEFPSVLEACGCRHQRPFQAVSAEGISFLVPGLTSPFWAITFCKHTFHCFSRPEPSHAPKEQSLLSCLS